MSVHYCHDAATYWKAAIIEDVLYILYSAILNAYIVSQSRELYSTSVKTTISTLKPAGKGYGQANEYLACGIKIPKHTADQKTRAKELNY